MKHKTIIIHRSKDVDILLGIEILVKIEKKEKGIGGWKGVWVKYLYKEIIWLQKDVQKAGRQQNLQKAFLEYLYIRTKIFF